MSRSARACLALCRRDLAVARTYSVSTLLGLLAGALALLSYYFIGRLIGRDPALALPGNAYFPFVCSGLALQIVVASVLSGLAGALARESAEGTLEPLLAAGASPGLLLAGGVMAPLLLAFGQSFVYLGTGVAAFGLDLSSARIDTALLGLVATLGASAPIGLLGAAVWLRLRRAGWVTTGALFAFGVAGGVYFPARLLPAPFDALAAWVPLNAGLEVVRSALFDGAGPGSALPAFGRLAVVAAASYPPAVGLLRWSFEQSRRSGTLAHV